MQSWEWGEFYNALGRRVERVRAGGLAAQIIFRPLPLGRREAYVPMGPLVLEGDLDERAFWQAVEGVVDGKTLFFECDLLSPVPFLTPTTPQTRQPRQVHIVDIAGKGSEELYEQFHSTLQQNVDRAQRENLSIVKEEKWERFYGLYLRTMERHELRPWHREYIQTLVDTLAPEGAVETWSVYHEDDLLATNLYTLFGGRVTHLYAGSASKKRNLQAPHFLHWQMMSEFAKRGIKEYDLGKVDPDKLPGLTTFKERFGGVTKKYPGNYKRVLRPTAYKLYTFAKSLIGKTR